MFLVLLGLFDVIAAGIFLAPYSFLGALAIALGAIILIKGILSLIGAFAAHYFYDYMGAIDVLTGIFLLYGILIPHFWILPFLKGVYCIFIGFMR